MNFSWLLKLLVPLLGQVITTYLIPMLNKTVKPKMEQILPVAERWVAAVETTGMSGLEKKVAATTQIIAQLKTEQGLVDIEKGLIDTAIQLAWLKLGLNAK